MAIETKERRSDVCEDWQDLSRHWQIREGTTYFNHGSFGLPPEIVRQARTEWIRRLDDQPMDFYLRQLEPDVERVLSRLGQFVGTARENLVFADNATYAMNIVANSFPLSSGDEVLLNDHEYGAVQRIWKRATEASGARAIHVHMPETFHSKEQVVEALFAKVTERTRLIVVSHITSPTAVILPVAEIVARANEREIATCVDGPHALAQVNLDIDQLGCDFYTASCHKWLCATLGSGFFYAHPRWHQQIEPINKSWGRLLPAMPEHWTEEFTWVGTRDPSAFLSIETAIEFMESIGIPAFQQRAHFLARSARQKLVEAFGTEPIMPDSPEWYGSMAHVPLPTAGATPYDQLQQKLWTDFGIEIPIIDFNDRWFVRVSTHLYNSIEQIDYLVRSLKSCW